MEVGAIRHGLDLGQNHIDTAEMYASGGAERIVGAAIESTKREDIFVATKLWKNHVADGLVKSAVEAMLQRLGTDYIDLLYIHAPWFDAPWQQAIPQINQLIDQGLVRYIGVSNFNAEHLQEALNITHHPIVANQMHYSYAHQQEVTPELQTLCQAHDISLVAYTPLERGAVDNQESLANVAAELSNATSSQVALAWLLAKGALPIPKASRPEHIEQNVLAANIHLDTRLMNMLAR